MAWAKKIGTPYVDDPVFQENFLYSLREKWQDLFTGVKIDDIDWRELVALAQSEKLANLPEAERKRISAERKRVREELKAKYGHARVDDHQVEIGAYLIEPPGIFMGRGAHPLRGRWKPRVYSYQVTLNLDEDAEIPEAPHTPPGEDKPRWGGIVNEHDSLWIARWLETLTGKIKYVWLAETSHLRQEREKAKYDKAWQLEANLKAVRAAIRKGMRDSDEKRRQVATVAYLIDRLAMRVGDEKDEDEADTVGASTLRVEHVHISDKEIQFDFLGKDSVQWQKSLPLDGDDRVLARNLQELARGKRPGDQLFDKIDSTHVNRFLGSIVEGLTAKVFRTYHATHAVRTVLLRDGNVATDTPGYRKEYIAKLANLEAAIVCNHKRTPPKTWQESLAKREVELQRLRATQPDVSKWQAQIAAREKALEKLLAAKPDLEKLQAQVSAREKALAQARAAQASLPNFDELIRAKQAALDQAVADQKKIEAAAHEALKKKQAALDALASKKTPKAKKALAEYNKRLRAARQAIAATKKSNEEKIKRAKARVAKARQALDATIKAQREKTRNAAKRVAQAEAALKRAQEALINEPRRYEERVAKARGALEKARRAPALVLQNYQERVERASLQLDLAKRTRDYNLGTSLKNYIDPTVFKKWGDHVGFDWKRLYTKALQRKFAWVEKVRGQWKE